MKPVFPLAALCSLAFLAGCGDDNDPVNEAVKGSISLTGTARVNETLSIVNDFRDRNGIELVETNASYQWYSNGVAVSGAIEATFVPTSTEELTDVHVVMDFLDDDGFAETLTSDSVNVFYPYTVSLVLDRQDSNAVRQSTDYGKVWSAVPEIVTSDAAEQHESPAIASGGNGTLVMVSESYANSSFDSGGDELDIVVSRSIDNGRTWSDFTLLVSSANSDNGDDYNPSIATDSNGTWVVVWTSEVDLASSGTDADIFYSKSVNDGVEWSDPAPLNPQSTTDTGRDDYPQISVNGEEWTLVWASNADQTDGSDDGDLEVITIHSSDAGGEWSEPVVISDNDTADDFTKMSINENGRGVIIWRGKADAASDSDIYFSTTSNFGGLWTSPEIVNTYAGENESTSDDTPSSVYADASGRFVAGWSGTTTDTGADKEAFYSTYVNGVSGWTDAAVLSVEAAAEESGPIFLPKTTSGWIAVWKEDSGDVLVRETDSADLTNWNDPVQIDVPANTLPAWVNH